jgi:Dual specificity phosphatase, catalytic domain
MLPEPHANLIVPRLWLGDKDASMDPTFLKEKGITTVFNCTKDLPFSPLIKRQYRVPVDDDLQPVELKNMELWSPEIVAKVLHEYNQGQTILVHKQRSAAVVAMTLIAKTGRTVDQAFEYIRSVRPVAFFPQANFEPSIRAFHVMLKRAVGM